MLIRLRLKACFAIAIAIAISSMNYAFSAAITNGLIESKVMLSDAWNMYIDRFITADGRVIDDANGDISHSEGQGYAMLIAVRLNDREMFHKIWRWTMDNLFVRRDGLPAWVWDPKATPHNRDIDDATDGNLLIAWALAEAGTLWNRVDYSRAARRLANIVGELDTAPSRFGPLLLPGSTAFGASDRPDGPVVNASYWVFPAFSPLKRISPKVDWVGLASNGLSVLKATRFGPERLPSDWISLANRKTAPAHGFAPVFGYDAIRVPLYLSWGQPDNREALAVFAPLLRTYKNGTPSVIDLRTGNLTEPLGGEGYKAITALLECALNGTRFPKELRTVRAELYYPTTLHILSLIAAGERYPKCLA